MCVNTPDDDFAFLLGLVFTPDTHRAMKARVKKHTQGNEAWVLGLCGV